jgi:hypothetical protein
MKKFYLAAIAIMASVSINGTNNISMGDSVRIHPVRLGGYSQQPVTMYNEAYCDSWTMSVTYPQGLMVKLVAGVTPLDGMTVPYIDRYGQEQIYTCPLNVSAAYATVGSTITANGYWDYNGNGEYDPYGTIKWTPGAHSMFEYNFYVDPSFRGGYVTFDGRITSGSDQRGAILQDVRFYQRCWVWVGYRRGDVTGNDRVNIDDVTTLTNYLLNGDDGSIDEFGIAAADMNGDGNVTIADVTGIINYILNK